MEKITIKKINEDIIYEKLENGLDVYLYVNKNIHNGDCILARKKKTILPPKNQKIMCYWRS